MKVGQILRSLREERGMTLEEVSKKLGVAKQTLYKYETGIITNIPLFNIEKLASIYKVNPSYIMGWEDSEPEPKTPEQPVETFPDDIVILARGAKTLTKDQVDLVKSLIDKMNKQNED